MQPVDPERIGGLGLRIVDQLAIAWGVAPFPGGKTVWATVPRAARLVRRGRPDQDPRRQAVTASPSTVIASRVG